MLNNKGFTVVELITSFVFTSILAVSLFAVVLNYRDKQTDISIETSLLDFKSLLTIDIEQDIQKKGLYSIDYCVNAAGNRVSKCIVLSFNDGTKKNLEIKEESKVDSFQNGDGTKDDFYYSLPYITYGGVKYEIPDAANVIVRSDFMLEQTTVVDGLETNTPLYKIRINFAHNDLDADMDLSVVAAGSKYLNTGANPYKAYNIGDLVVVQLNSNTQRKFRVIQNSNGYNGNIILLYDDVYDNNLVLNNIQFNSIRNAGNSYDASSIKSYVDAIAATWTNATTVRLITSEEVGYIIATCPKYRGINAPNVSLASAPSWLVNKNYWTMSEKLLSDAASKDKKVWFVNGGAKTLADAYVDSQYALRPVIEVSKAYLTY